MSPDLNSIEKLPHSDVSELYLLASIVFEPTTHQPIISTVSAADFWTTVNRYAFEEAARLHSASTLTRETFFAAVKERIGNDAWNALAERLEEFPTSVDHELHCKILKTATAKRRLSVAADALQNALASKAPLNGEWESVQQAKDELAAIESPAPQKIIPAVPLDVLMQEEDVLPDYVLKPFLTKGCLTLLQGTPKAGKSSWALYMALCSAIGVWIAGDPLSISKPRRVLFLSWEDPLRRIKARARQYQLGLELGGYPENLLIVRDQDRPFIDIGDQKGQDQILRSIDGHKADLFMADTISFLRPGRDENSADEMDPVMQGIRRIMQVTGVSFTGLHHTRKGSTQGEDQASIAERMRGSSVISAAADIIIDWGNHDSNNITLVRALSKDDPVDNFEAHWIHDKETDCVRWKLEPPRGKPKRGHGTDTKVLEAITSLLSTGSLPTRLAISKLLDIPKDTARSSLDRLLEAKNIEEVPAQKGEGISYKITGM